MMTNDKNIDIEDMLALINSLHSLIIDWSCSGSECEYVYVPARDPRVMEVFRKCGFTNKQYESNIVDNELIDLNIIGFRYGNYWDISKGYMIKNLKARKKVLVKANILVEAYIEEDERGVQRIVELGKLEDTYDFDVVADL